MRLVWFQCYSLLYLWNVSFKNDKSLCCFYSFCCFTQDVPSPFSLCNIHHFLHCRTETWQDRQMSMLRKLMGCRLCLLLRCDKTVRHQLKGYMANQSRTWLGAATTTNQQCWWGLELEALSGESTRACFCVLFAIRTDVSAACRFDVDMHQTLFLDGCWWVWHITTKYLVASGQVHILLLGMCIKFFFFLFFVFVKESRFQSFVVISLFFFF